MEEWYKMLASFKKGYLNQKKQKNKRERVFLWLKTLGFFGGFSLLLFTLVPLAIMYKNISWFYEENTINYLNNSLD